MAVGETKAQRFERIAERRVNETLRSLRLLGNLADKRNYEYSDEQISLILAALDREYRVLRSKFKTTLTAEHVSFSFRKGP
jgi:hypothetical protein